MYSTQGFHVWDPFNLAVLISILPVHHSSNFKVPKEVILLMFLQYLLLVLIEMLLYKGSLLLDLFLLTTACGQLPFSPS